MSDSWAAFLLQVNLWEMLSRTTPLGYAVLAVLIVFSLASWTIIFSKWQLFRRAKDQSQRFLRAFRGAKGFDAVAVASEQFRPSPLVAVFDFGYEELHRQISAKGRVGNKLVLERTLQLGASEELAKLEQNLNWLATTATVTPFIGLFGTVIGIIRSFQDLGMQGSASLRAVAPGISESLLATAVGLFAAIPAAIFYNHFGHVIREADARMEDFSLEFMNLVDRSFGD